MTTWKSKLFGDNRFNFYGWIGTGLFVMGFSIYMVVLAIRAGALRSPSCLLLVAIYFIAVGHFCISLQNYCARVAKAIEIEDEKKKSIKMPSNL
jgi:hypothetical protein